MNTSTTNRTPTASWPLRALALAALLILVATGAFAAANRTELIGLWSAGCPKPNGQIKNWGELEPTLDGFRLAVEFPDLSLPDPPLKFTSSKWTLRKHLAATGDKPIVLVVLLETAGTDSGRNFKRTPGPWFPAFEEFKAAVAPWLTSRVVALELGNEYGIVAHGRDRIVLYTYLLGLAEQVAPWLRAEHPGITLVIGGLAGPSQADQLNAFIIANGSDYLRRNSVLDYHTQEISPAEVGLEIDRFRALGWEPVVLEYFSASPRPGGKTFTSFTGTLDNARVAHQKKLRWTAAFTGFYESDDDGKVAAALSYLKQPRPPSRPGAGGAVVSLAVPPVIAAEPLITSPPLKDWGHNRQALTNELAVTGPGCNWRSGRGSEPDHYGELVATAALLRSEPQPPPVETEDPVLGALEEAQQAVDRAITAYTGGTPPPPPPDDPPPPSPCTPSGALSAADVAAAGAVLKGELPTQLWRFKQDQPKKWTVIGPKTVTPGSALGNVDPNTVGYGDTIAAALADYQRKRGGFATGGPLTACEIVALEWYSKMDSKKGPTSLRHAISGLYHPEFYRSDMGDPVHGKAVATIVQAVDFLKARLGAGQ